MNVQARFPPRIYLLYSPINTLEIYSYILLLGYFTPGNQVAIVKGIQISNPSLGSIIVILKILILEVAT